MFGIRFELLVGFDEGFVVGKLDGTNVGIKLGTVEGDREGLLVGW